MQKRLLFLLTTLLLSIATMAQGKQVVAKKSLHLTFMLEQNTFYYTKGATKEKVKVTVADSLTFANIIDAAITENKVDKKDLNVLVEGDDLMDHPSFELLLDTILSKTVSEVRVKTNVFE